MSSELIDLLQLIISALGLLSLFLLWWQIRQTNIWNKLQSQRMFITRAVTDIRKELHVAAEKLGVELKARTVPISEEDVKRLWDDTPTYHLVISYLNELESTSMAVRIGTVDNDIAFEAHCNWVVNSFRVYEPIIARMRSELGDDLIYIELDNLAHLWKEKDEKQKMERKERLRRMQQRDKFQQGVKKKV